MAMMNVSIPDPMRDWVEAQAERYGDASDYVRELIRRDQEKVEALRELERLIDEGFESGISDRALGEIFEDARERAQVLRRP